MDRKIMCEYALCALRENWGYIMGASGQICSEAFLDYSAGKWPEYSAKTYKYGREKWMGKRIVDCSGLTMLAAKAAGGSLPHGSHSQYTGCCGRKGKLLGGAPEDGGALRAGCGVFKYYPSNKRYGHAGLYVGGGIVIEAKGAAYGVVTSNISDWGYFGEWKDCDFTDDYEGVGLTMVTLSFGTRGECVKTAQEHLNAWAEADLREMLSTDGIFGAKTLAAVKAFQASHGLADSGVIDEKTWNALIGESTDNDNSDENDGNTESDTDGAEVYSQRLEELLFELDTLINKYRG